MRLPSSTRWEITLPELNNMVESGEIRYVTEPTDWCAAMVPVIKKTGAVRICVDLKQLNTAVRREHHMLHSLEDIAPKLAESKVFSTLDAQLKFPPPPRYSNARCRHYSKDWTGRSDHGRHTGS